MPQNIAFKRPQSLWATFLLAAALAPGCGKSAKSAADADATSVAVEADADTLSKRMQVESQAIAIDSGSGTSGLELIGLPAVVTLLQVGVVTPPSVGGSLLQADSVTMNGAVAYVTYNMAGDVGSGGVDVINTTVAALPVITSNLTSSTSDYNAAVVAGSNLYVVGENPTAANTAFLSQIALNNGLLTSTVNTYNLPSYAGTDVAVGSGSTMLYATSGSGGGLTTFTLSSMAQTNYTAINDARSVRVNPNDNTVRVLSGTPGTLTALTAAGITPQATALGGAATAQAKSTVQVGSKWTLASLGEAGFKLICTANNATLASMPAVTVSGLAAAKSVTNGVTASIGNLVFAADGEAGVYVYQINETNAASPCPAATLTLVGSLNFGTSLSANAVYSQNGLLFVVDGLGGLRILTVTVL